VDGAVAVDRGVGPEVGLARVAQLDAVDARELRLGHRGQHQVGQDQERVEVLGEELVPQLLREALGALGLALEEAGRVDGPNQGHQDEGDHRGEEHVTVVGGPLDAVHAQEVEARDAQAVAEAREGLREDHI